MMMYYAMSLDHCHLIWRAITAGGCVERRTNCSPSRQTPRDSLCQCRPPNLVRHIGENSTD